MAITNYTELQTAVANRMHRTNLTSYIPDFIAIGEAKLNRRLRLREQEQLAYTPTTSDRFYALPNRFIELLDLRIRQADEDDSRYVELIFTSPQQLYQYYSDPIRPTRYTVRNQLELNSIPDQAYRLLMHYYKGWDIAGDSTNWLLTNYPEIYLFSALVEAADHVRNDNDQQRYATKLEVAIAEAQELDERSRNDAELSMGDYVYALGYNNRGFDVTRGY